MKKHRFLTIVLAASLSAVAGGSALVSSGCKRSGGPAAAARRYQCPMHPEIVRDAPGDCPICGMKLVPIEDGAPKPAEAPTTGPEASPRSRSTRKSKS